MNAPPRAAAPVKDEGGTVELATLTSQDTPDVNAWADWIRPHLVGAVEHIIAAGRELNEAKASLPHGQFGPLLAELGLSVDSARQLMRTARRYGIPNREPVHGLPAAASVLDVLARLDDDTLTRAVESGRLTASTTRVEARGLVAHERWLDEMACTLAARVRDIDDAIDALPWAIQERDHMLDVGRVYVVWMLHHDDTSREREVHDGLTLLAGASPWTGCTGWPTAAVWLACVSGLRIDKSFGAQLVERCGGATLAEAARRWLDEDEAVAS